MQGLRPEQYIETIKPELEKGIDYMENLRPELEKGFEQLKPELEKGVDYTKANDLQKKELAKNYATVPAIHRIMNMRERPLTWL